MFEPGEVVYAFVKNIHPPKNKYFVTIYQDDELRIVTCFTTTQNRVGIPLEQLSHGYVKKNNLLVGYFFDKNIEVGLDPEGVPFKFPRNCVIPFDYGVQIGTKSQFLNSIEKEKVVCKLHPKEYVDLVYAMYKSPMTDSKYKPYLDKVLQQICQ